MSLDSQISSLINTLYNGNESIESCINNALALSNEDKQAFLSVLESESTGSYFNNGHRAEKMAELAQYGYQRSTQFSALLGQIFQSTDAGSSHTHFSQDINWRQACSQLKQDGYTLIPDALNNDNVQGLRRDVEKLTFFTKKDLKKQRFNDINAVNNAKDNAAWVVDQQDVLNIPLVQKILMDQNLLKTVKQYLGAPPIHVQANIWWSKADGFAKDDLSRNAQMFHQDKEFIKFAKVFFYLTDVGNDNGPHHFIAGSHKDFNEVLPEDYFYGERLDDEYLQEKYTTDRFKTFTGNAGTMIIEDTNGFHKGEAVRKDPRLILQLEFASSMYFNPVPAFTYKGLTPAYKQFLYANPRFSSNYNDIKYTKDTREANKAFWISKIKLIIKKLIRKK